MLAAHTDWVRTVDIDASGTCIVSGSDDGDIRVWTMNLDQQRHDDLGLWLLPPPDVP